MLTIGITGTTSGIGFWTKEWALNEGFLVIPYDRHSNDSIRNHDLVLNIFESCDVIFNNAYDEDHQVKLLSKMWEKWSGQSKHIINIGSYLGVGFDPIDPALDPRYSIDKKILRDKSFNISKKKDRLTSTIINLGPTDTRIVQHHDVPKLSKENWISVCDFILDNNFCISEITLYAK